MGRDVREHARGRRAVRLGRAERGVPVHEHLQLRREGRRVRHGRLEGHVDGLLEDVQGAVGRRPLVEERAERGLAVDVFQVLRAEHGPLELLRLQRVDHEPGDDALEVAPGLRCRLAARELEPEQAPDLGDEDDADLLPVADAAHAVDALRVVAPDHVLAQGHEGRGVGHVADVHARRVDHVVEREAPLEGHAALLLGHRPARRSHQNLLLVVVVEVDDAVAPGQAPLQQLAGDLEVPQPRDERARVDQRVHARLRRRRREVQDVRDGPADVEVRNIRDLGVQHHIQHGRVVALLVAALAQLEGQQVRRRAREADAPREEHVAADGLAARGDLEALRAHVRRHHRRAQEVVDRVGLAAPEAVEPVHLVRVRPLQELELDDRLRVVVARAPAEAADAPAGAQHPELVAPRRRPVARGADLAAEVGRERVGDLVKVLAAQAAVAVGQDRQPDGHVRVGELRRRRRHVLADEGHRELEPRPRHARVVPERARDLPLLEQAVAHAVHLGEAVGHEGAEPVRGEVQQLLLVRRRDQRRRGRREAQPLEEPRLAGQRGARAAVEGPAPRQRVEGAGAGDAARRVRRRVVRAAAGDGAERSEPREPRGDGSFQPVVGVGGAGPERAARGVVGVDGGGAAPLEAVDDRAEALEPRRRDLGRRRALQRRGLVVARRGRFRRGPGRPRLDPVADAVRRVRRRDAEAPEPRARGLGLRAVPDEDEAAARRHDGRRRALAAADQIPQQRLAVDLGRRARGVVVVVVVAAAPALGPERPRAARAVLAHVAVVVAPAVAAAHAGAVLDVGPVARRPADGPALAAAADDAPEPLLPREVAAPRERLVAVVAALHGDAQRLLELDAGRGDGARGVAVGRAVAVEVERRARARAARGEGRREPDDDAVVQGRVRRVLGVREPPPRRREAPVERRELPLRRERRRVRLALDRPHGRVELAVAPRRAERRRELRGGPVGVGGLLQEPPSRVDVRRRDGAPEQVVERVRPRDAREVLRALEPGEGDGGQGRLDVRVVVGRVQQRQVRQPLEGHAVVAAVDRGAEPL